MRPIAKSFGAVLILSIALWAACSWSGRVRHGPVIIFLVDTLRFDRMSAYGASRPTSPAAAKLAAEGVRYDAAYSVAPWTRPAVASLFTSRWPAEVGAIGRWGGLAPQVPVMADEFRVRGWETAAFCGQPNIYFRELGFRRGFSTFYPVHPGDDAADGTVSTADRVVEPAIHWIESRESPRFFLFIHVVDPHNGDISSNPNPYRHWIPGYENLFSGAVPMDLSSREWRLAKYDALVRQSDDQFARLRRALEAKGFWKKALVVYLSDHGEEFYEHGAVYHGQSLFEELIRVPLIVKGPGWRRPGVVEKSPVSLLDLLPSIADWAGLRRDPQWRGEAIDRASPNSARAIYFSEELDRWRLYGIRRGRRKMIVSIHPPFRIQFDLERDPGEQAPVPNEPDVSNILEEYRREEVASHGGLRIWKTGAVRASLSGKIDVPGSMPPYLSLPDRDRFPIDPRRPNELPVVAEIDPRLPFELHIESFDGQPALTPHLTVLVDGRRQALVGEENVPGTPVAIRNGPTTRLPPSEMSEITKRMRSLGYLGAGNPD